MAGFLSEHFAIDMHQLPRRKKKAGKGVLITQQLASEVRFPCSDLAQKPWIFFLSLLSLFLFPPSFSWFSSHLFSSPPYFLTLFCSCLFYFRLDSLDMHNVTELNSLAPLSWPLSCPSHRLDRLVSSDLCAPDASGFMLERLGGSRCSHASNGDWWMISHRPGMKSVFFFVF